MAYVEDFFVWVEQRRLFIINNRSKFQCPVAYNKAYRAMQNLYANCMGKAKTL